MSTDDKCYYIDLFAGCGGLSLGLSKSGWNGLFAVEKNNDAFSTLSKNLIYKSNHFNWPTWLEIGPLDINELIINKREQLESINGKVNLVVGGPPCQGFSMAGKRKENDYRNTLVDRYIEFIKIIKPKILFLENVHGFTVGFDKEGIKQKPYSQYVKEKLSQLGYCVTSKIIDVSEYGVPQKRRRFILTGILDEKTNNFFSILEKNRDMFLKNNRLKCPITIDEAIGDLLKNNGTYSTPGYRNFLSGKYGSIQSDYQKLVRIDTNNNLLVDSHRFANHKKETIDLFEYMIKNIDTCRRVSPDDNIVPGLKKRGITVLKEDSVCSTITSIPDDFVHYCEPRIMTVREMARIQSFPDDFEFVGKYTTGGNLRKVDVPRYTQVANAVPPLFAQQVGQALKEML